MKFSAKESDSDDDAMDEDNEHETASKPWLPPGADTIGENQATTIDLHSLILCQAALQTTFGGGWESHFRVPARIRFPVVFGVWPQISRLIAGIRAHHLLRPLMIFTMR